MFKILIVIFDMFLLSSKFMDVAIANAPFTTPFDISMFLVMKTKAPIVTFFICSKWGSLIHCCICSNLEEFVSSTTSNTSLDVNNS
jgi:hypothetical protein